MKRSDMILKLQRRLFDLSEFPMTKMRMAELIITFLEEEGMTAPPRTVYIEYNNEEMLKGIQAYKDGLRWDDE